MKRINDIQAWMGAAALCLSSCPLSAQQVVPTGEPVLSWQDSTQLKVAFSVDVEITSDDRLILTPRLTTKAGDTLTLPPVELAGKRNRRYFDRRAALRGEERVAVAAAADVRDRKSAAGAVHHSLPAEGPELDAAPRRKAGKVGRMADRARL